MNKKAGKSVPPVKALTTNTRQKGAFVDFHKGISTVKQGHFENTNQELHFAKYCAKFGTPGKGRLF